MEKIYEIEYLEGARKFLKSLPIDVRKKVSYNVDRVLTGNSDKTIFKKITDDFWEIRTRYKGQAYRLFAFFDKYNGKLIVSTNGINKKTQKTPQTDLKNAEKIQKTYYIKNYSKK